MYGRRTPCAPVRHDLDRIVALVCLQPAADSLTTRIPSPRPPAVKRHTRQNQQQSDRRSSWPLQPNIYRQRQRARHKQPWYPRISPAPIRPRRIRFCPSHAKQRHNREPIKNPSRKNKKTRQLFKRARQRHQTRQHALKNQRPPWSPIFRIHSIRYFEKQSIPRHSVSGSRPAQHRRVHRPEGRDHHRHRDPCRRATPGYMLDHIRRNMLRVRDRRERQHFQTRRAEQKINQRHKRDSAYQRARKIPRRILHFRSDQIQIFPTVISPQCRRQRRQKRAQHSATH
jgi:hypothetical protein